MSQLPAKEVASFFTLHKQLLVYANQRGKIVSDVKTVADLERCPMDEIGQISDYLYDSSEVLTEYCRDNPKRLADDDLVQVKSWQHFIKGNFYLWRLLKKHAIFLTDQEPSRAFGVLSLTQPFDEVMGVYDSRDLPIYLNTVLLPWKGEITYSGLLGAHPITFGAGIRHDINTMYRQARAECGIITTLPLRDDEPTTLDRLRGYLSSEENRERYHDEIFELLDREPKLLPDYHQMLGQAAARGLRRDLRWRGVLPGWFAIYKDFILASGQSEEEARDQAEMFISASEKEFIYVFELKAQRERKGA